jgi:ABC-type nitrate/sulfonate/bicarbonate transport system substrate-binding protein
MGISKTLRGCIVVMSLLAVATATSAQQMQDVSIALGSVGFGTAPARIAKQLGLYEKHRINAKIVVMDSGAAATTALVSRSTDTALSGSGELVAAEGRGQKIAIIANVYNGSSGTLVISKAVAERLGIPATAPAIERLKALSGLVIASPGPASAYTATLKGAAASAGISIRFTYMSPQTMASAFEAGAIQGYIAGAPSWAPPVVKGTGIVWISGPKKEFPPENMPVSAGSLQAMRDFAEANPDLMKRLAAVFADLSEAIDERPADVKEAVGKVYPNLDSATLDLLFASEAAAWKAKPLTVADIKHDIGFIKSSGEQPPQIDSIDPASMLLP